MPAAARHVDVGQDQVGQLLPRQLQAGRTRLRFQDAITIAPQRLRKGEPKPGVIIDK